MSEHESEPTPGLPGRLPEDERMLWQGAPSWRALALRALHARKVAAYFFLLAAWNAVEALGSGATPVAAVRSASWLLVLGAVASAVLVVLAWAIARTSLYTITTRRLVLRFGVALPIAMNLPFKRLQSAGIVRHGDGTADLPLALTPGERIGYLVTWPHVRPWHLLLPQPTLRGVPDGERVAAILAAALRGTEPGAAPVRPSPAPPRPSLTAAA